MNIDDMLIEKVKHYPILFDYAHSEYRSLKKKERAWREIAATLNLNVRDCKRLWRELRITYKRCKRMVAESSSGAKKPRRSWRYFGAMSFLDNVTDTKRNPLFDLRNESPDPLSRSSENLTHGPRERVDSKCLMSQTSQSSTTSSSRESEDSKHVQSLTRQNSTTSIPREKERVFSDDFKEFIDLAGSSISDNFESKVFQPQVENSTQALDSTQALGSTQVLESNQAQGSTTPLFGILAAKIKHTNLPPNLTHSPKERVVSEYLLSRTSQSPTTSSPRENEDSKHVQSLTRQSSTISIPREKERAFSDDFKEFIDLAGSSISDNFESKVFQPQVENLTQALDSTQVLESNQAQDSTTILFGILAAKIKHTNLPPCVVNRIEAQVSAIVFGEIESFYSAMNKSI